MIEIPEGYQIVRAIVRCKDCKYWNDKGLTTYSWTVCNRLKCTEGCTDTCWDMDAEDFCSRGEKR